MVRAPVVRGRKGEYKKDLEKLARQGSVRARIDGVLRSLDDDITLDKRKNHTIEVVVDRLLVKAGIEHRLAAAVESAMKLAGGLVPVAVVEIVRVVLPVPVPDLNPVLLAEPVPVPDADDVAVPAPVLDPDPVLVPVPDVVRVPVVVCVVDAMPLAWPSLAGARSAWAASVRAAASGLVVPGPCDDEVVDLQAASRMARRQRKAVLIGVPGFMIRRRQSDGSDS